MITVTTEYRPSGKLPWCQICGTHESKTITLAPNGREMQGSVMHLCDNCIKELIEKLQEGLSEGE